MKFVKMHGIGNDYIFVETFTQPSPDDPGALSVRLSAPHTGIGADGIIFVDPSDEADAGMRVFNADGSEAQICGNGLRCVAKLLYDEGLCRQREMTIATRAGLHRVWLGLEGDKVVSVTADMGFPAFDDDLTLTACGRTLSFVPVSMTNPHAVTFDEPALGGEFYELGPAIERHPAFPERTNVEFVTVTGPESLNVRVWERGSGETLACGSGACAALAASRGFLTDLMSISARKCAISSSQSNGMSFASP
ncbi:MAG: diaminopimelate epimerase [Clostridia bacterium]|nr:diaminopimelate epimerase [Clostridia bacterium]